ncbi:FRG domain-containing protein [Shewanella alkalitolerans]|uniref:FRG domain-containing protein n=1 Tax=Shewanella alkalitolerans TaxID=2864209 RepID=UPI001C65C0C5|nr:FRG domain-containing protein [Shewanella alkalitolerans]QYJ99289.1 FRG domain-containing protein [Shewanella alkalitolerans]
MKGQWIGRFQGTNTGSVTINIDELKDEYSGVAYFIDADKQKPSLAAHFRFCKSGKNSFDFKTLLINPLNPFSFIETNWESLVNVYQGVEFPNSADVSFTLVKDRLEIKAKTNVATEITGQLQVSKCSTPSSLDATTMTWQKYKNHVLEIDDDFLYRGQNQPWKLQTGFHRRERYDITKYQRDDIPQLHRALSSKTKHVFNLNDSQENGAFLNLAQHHGYPTPLLDWTYSPYVAAFFAFRSISKQQASETNKFVRIFIFDHVEWKRTLIQNNNMLSGQNHLSVIDLLAIENSRMVPQQASTTITNVADIESYIKLQEGVTGKKFLKAIDIPWSERNLVVKELTLMGLTAGSLFPGLDGTCEELKEKMFE